CEIPASLRGAAQAATRLDIRSRGRRRRAHSLNIERLAQDALLLEAVRGRIALAGARAVRSPDVAERHSLRHQLALPRAREHEAPGAHVLRLFLHPDDLRQV